MSSVICYQLQRVGHYILPPRQIIILINLLLERLLIQLPVDHCLVYPDRKNWGEGKGERRREGERREKGGREEGKRREGERERTQNIKLNQYI